MRKERYRSYCQSEPERERGEKDTSLNHVSFYFRWSRSVLTKFGLNSEFWPDLPQPTNTHSSKVNCLAC